MGRGGGQGGKVRGEEGLEMRVGATWRSSGGQNWKKKRKEKSERKAKTG